MKEHPELSRRRAMVRAAAFLAGSSLASFVPGQMARAQQPKASKSAMKYQDSPSGDKQCSNCTHFQPPSGCAIVEGSVAPQGYCIAWVKKT
jgi:hypothetical protein